MMGSCTGRIVDRGTDPWNMGQWSYCVLTGGSRQLSILLVTGYRPGKRSGKAGPRTAWSQQTTMLIKEQREEDPHQDFLIDLQQWIKEYQTENMEVLVCLDANKQWTESSAIAKFAEDLNLIRRAWRS